MQMSAAVGLAALSTIATNYTKSLVAQGHELIGCSADGYRPPLLIAAASVLIGLILRASPPGQTYHPKMRQKRTRQKHARTEMYEYFVLESACDRGDDLFPHTLERTITSSVAQHLWDRAINSISRTSPAWTWNMKAT